MGYGRFTDVNDLIGVQIEFFDETYPFEPFLFLGGLCFVAATGAYLLPKDTREEQLDNYFEADN